MVERFLDLLFHLQWSSHRQPIRISGSILPNSLVAILSRRFFISDHGPGHAKAAPVGSRHPLSYQVRCRHISAADPEGHKLMLFDVARRNWTELFDLGTGWIYRPMWSRDGKYIYFSDPSHPGTPVYRLRVADHKLEQVSTEDFK